MTDREIIRKTAHDVRANADALDARGDVHRAEEARMLVGALSRAADAIERVALLEALLREARNLYHTGHAAASYYYQPPLDVDFKVILKNVELMREKAADIEARIDAALGDAK